MWGSEVASILMETLNDREIIITKRIDNGFVNTWKNKKVT